MNLNDIFADIKGIDIANSNCRYINKIAVSFFSYEKIVDLPLFKKFPCHFYNLML